MSTLIPPTPAANKSAEQHQEPSEQDQSSSLQGSEVDFRTSSRPQWLDGTSRDSK